MALLQGFLLCIVKSSHPNCVFDKAEMALLQGYLLRIDDLVETDGGNYTCLITTSRTNLTWTYRVHVIAGGIQGVLTNQSQSTKP